MTGRSQNHDEVLQIVLVVNVFETMQENYDVEINFYLADYLQKGDKSMSVSNLEVILSLNCCEFLKFIVRLKEQEVMNSLDLA